MSNFSPILNLLASVPIALITAWFTVRFALRRYQSEKIFERRLDVYTKIIDSLHHMKHTTDRQINAYRKGYEIPKKVEEQLNEIYGDNLAEFRRLSDLGALIFSKEAIIILDELKKGLNVSSDQESWIEHMIIAVDAITICLENIRPVAKRDLNA